MNCPQCIAADAEPTRNEFRNGCLSCQARALAVTRVDQLGRTQALAAIAQVFGEQAQEGEAMVREWLGKMRQARAGKVPM